MTFWPQSLMHQGEISTLDNSLTLKLLDDNVFTIRNKTIEKLMSVKFALNSINCLKEPLSLLLSTNDSLKDSKISKNYKQELVKIGQNLDFLFKKDEIHETLDAIYFILVDKESKDLQILLKSNYSLIEIDSDFAFLKWYIGQEELYYSIQKLPWTIHGVYIKEIISKGLDFFISFGKSSTLIEKPRNLVLKSGIQKQIQVKDLATFTLYLDSRITVVFTDRTIVKTDLSGNRFNVLGRDGQEILLGNSSVGYESYIRLVKQFIEWNLQHRAPSSSYASDFLKSPKLEKVLNRSKEFLKELEKIH